MNSLFILMFVFGVLALFFGLLLSTGGTSTNLLSSGDQDLELFKQTKDRGFIKILQILMFIDSLALIVCGILSLLLK